MSVTMTGPLFTGKVRPAIRRAAHKAERMILSEARSLSRVKTGRMRAGWTVSIAASGDGVKLTLSNPVPYTVYQEFGTASITPMLAGTRAMEHARSVFASQLGIELSSALGASINAAETAVLGALGL